MQLNCKLFSLVFIGGEDLPHNHSRGKCIYMGEITIINTGTVEERIQFSPVKCSMNVGLDE